MLRSDDTTERTSRTERLPEPDDDATTVVTVPELASELSETRAVIDLEDDDERMPKRRTIGGALIGGALVGVAAIVLFVLVAVTHATSAPDTPGVAIAVASSDDTVQWIRVTDGAGKRRVSGTPRGTATVAPGPYVLSAKLVGRSIASGPIEVRADLSLDCEPQRAGHVVCADRSGGATYELVP